MDDRGSLVSDDVGRSPGVVLDPGVGRCVLRIGGARVQTVEKSANARYWSLLDEFESYTGVPVLLNTSFNIQEPIVCTPDEALATFRGSNVDALAIGDYWVTRGRNGESGLPPKDERKRAVADIPGHA